jgi:hypothetical protein
LWRLVEGNEARIGGDLRVCHCGAFEFEGVAEKDDFWWKRKWLLPLAFKFKGGHTTSFIPWTYTSTSFTCIPAFCRNKNNKIVSIIIICLNLKKLG